MSDDFAAAYKANYEVVLEEHRQVFERQDIGDVRRLMDAIINCKGSIFVMGVGREGIATRSFAMRLMHLGKTVHFIWDDTTPGMHEGDLFIVTNGSGCIGHILYVYEQAKKTGASVAMITGSPNNAPSDVDVLVFVPASVFKGTDTRVVPSMQPMGNLFEQHLFLLFDIIVMMLEKELNLSHAEMEGRHRNIE